MKLPSFPRSRPSSASSSPVSSPRVAGGKPEQAASKAYQKPWPEQREKAVHLCLPLPRSRSRKRTGFSSELTDGSSPKSPVPPPLSQGSSPVFPRPESSSLSSSPSRALKSKVGSSVRHVPLSIIKEMEQVFAQFDANGDGKISADELGRVLRSLGDNTTEEEARLMVAEADTDGDGFISLQEFIDFNGKGVHQSGEIASEELTAVFDVFDLDKNGHITAEELYSVLTNLGDKKATLEDCKKMIRGVDRKGAGHVDFDDFKLMMTSA